MNAYIPLTRIKAELGITKNESDDLLLSNVEAASRQIDSIAGRHFFSLSATRHYDAATQSEVFTDDLIAVDSLVTDSDGDGIYEQDWSPEDYLLYPLNAEADSPHSLARPYTRIVARRGFVFPGLPTGVRVSGVFGYSRRAVWAPESLSANVTPADSSFDLKGGEEIQAGHTVLVGLEQMYVRSRAGDTLTVERGVNGTTPDDHPADTAIAQYVYPDGVSQSTLIVASRTWRRRRYGYANAQGSPDGTFRSWKATDPDVESMMGQYRKLVV